MGQPFHSRSYDRPFSIHSYCIRLRLKVFQPDFSQPRGIGGEMRGHGLRFGRFDMAADPGEKRHPTHNDKSIDFGHVFGRQLAHAGITSQPSRFKIRNGRIGFDETDRGGKIIHEPAKAAVVEIDQSGVGPVNQQVRKPHVSVDETITFAVLSICRQTGTNSLLCLSADGSGGSR